MVSYELVINGLDHAWRKEIGCDCARCQDSVRTANTSVSLLGWQDQILEQHILIDAGGGVSESLLENTVLQETLRLDWVLLTHWHADHVSELHRIINSIIRSRKRLHLAPQLPNVWLREGSRMWLERQQPGALNLLNIVSSLEFNPPGRLLEPVALGLEGLSVTPVTISHSSADLFPPFGEEHLNCCTGFILESGQFKTALLWDLDATSTWLETPNEDQQEAFDKLFNCDVLLIDCNTWSYNQTNSGLPASHVSFSMVMRFARALKPKTTYLMHLSGHEDAIGDGFGWTNQIWQLEAQKAWQKAGLTGLVRVPSIGERIILTQAETLVV